MPEDVFVVVEFDFNVVNGLSVPLVVECVLEVFFITSVGVRGL